MTIFLLLMAAHLVADFVLQTEDIALGKNKNLNLARHGVPWWYWMSAHAATHGLAVGLITGSTVLGLVEFVAHWYIDLRKCQGRSDIHEDQIYHILCKLLYVRLI